MFLKNITIFNYRSLSTTTVEFSKDINIIIGKNGAGKTSILECITILGQGKSFRPNAFKNQTKPITIKGVFVNKNQETILFKRNKKNNIKINNETIKTRASLYKTIKIIFLSPEEENIINNKFSRLKYFDRLMCQNEEQSLKDLIIFNKTIKQRNAALEKKDKNIKIWDKQLNESAQRVWKNRKTFFTKIKEKINIEMPQYYVNYKSTKPINYLDQLTKNITIDLLKQKTTQGPHKDKIEITFNKQDLKDTGSQGEKKLFTSTLKHIESNLKKSPKPIILLDDFFAKLDKKNIIKTLLKHTNKNQTIITTTDTTNINKEIEEIQRQNQTKEIKIIKL
tara:strand:+ start:900 stop:1910 length:1011 start_codon:yes stop_codon:yes gene_type:complete